MTYMYVIWRKYIMLAIRIPSDIENRLALLAEKTGRTKTFYARKAITEFVEDMEDIYLALERLENPGKTWTMEEIEAEIGLED
jgi:RHH-type transcriptional regulator, rel operon repressor / antitoxin RelB